MPKPDTELAVKAGSLPNDPSAAALMVTVITRDPRLVRLIRGIKKEADVSPCVMTVVTAACHLEDKVGEELHRVC